MPKPIVHDRSGHRGRSSDKLEQCKEQFIGLRRRIPSMIHSNHSSASSHGSLSGFPEEDLRVGGKHNVGYFPAWLGQSFLGGNCVVVRKLGWGQYSSVWLARDKELDQYSALKLLTVEATSAMNAKELDEEAILQHISKSRKELHHPGAAHVLSLLDTFRFMGPLGEHLCLVTEVLGFDLNFFRKAQPHSQVAIPIVKRIVRQILLGLDFLHIQCGIVHTDLKHDNIFFRPSGLDNVVLYDLKTDPSRTYTCPTQQRPLVIPIVSQPLSVTVGLLSPDAIDIVIGDLGASHFRDRHLYEVIQPFALRAPEVILGYPWDIPVDIWSLGCLTYELVTACWLFEPNTEAEWTKEEDHLARMTEAIGESFPLKMLKRSKHRSQFFTEQGSFAHFTRHKEPNPTIEDGLLMDVPRISQEDLTAIASFIRRCLVFDPNRRATAKELLDDPGLV